MKAPLFYELYYELKEEKTVTANNYYQVVETIFHRKLKWNCNSSTLPSEVQRGLVSLWYRSKIDDGEQESSSRESFRCYSLHQKQAGEKKVNKFNICGLSGYGLYNGLYGSEKTNVNPSKESWAANLLLVLELDDRN